MTNLGLAEIPGELAEMMRRDVRTDWTDWTVREGARAQLRAMTRRLLMTHGYPQGQQPGAITLVMEQLEAMAHRSAQEHDHGGKSA